MSVLDSAHWHSRTLAKGHPNALRHIRTGMISLRLPHTSFGPARISLSTDAEHRDPPLTHQPLRKVPGKFTWHVPVIREAQKIDHFFASGIQWFKLYCPISNTNMANTRYQGIKRRYGRGLCGQIKTTSPLHSAFCLFYKLSCPKKKTLHFILPVVLNPMWIIMLIKMSSVFCVPVSHSFIYFMSCGTNCCSSLTNSITIVQFFPH